MNTQFCSLEFLYRLIDLGVSDNYGMLLLYNGTYQFCLFTDICKYKSYPLSFSVLKKIRSHAILHGLEFRPQFCDEQGRAL